MVVTIPAGYELPRDYWILSLINAFCCCFWIGFCAARASVQTREANRYQDIERAFTYSKKALRLNIIGIGIGSFLIFVFFLIFLSIIQNLNQFTTWLKKPLN